jgi:hypothetical protein
MDVVWTTFFWLIPIWTFVLIPFSTFYYESDDGLLMNPGGDKKSRIRPAITYTLAVVIIITILYVIAYLTTSEADIPVQAYTAKTIAQGINEQNAAQTRIIFTSNAGERGINFTKDLLEDMGVGDALFVAGQSL